MMRFCIIPKGSIKKTFVVFFLSCTLRLGFVGTSDGGCFMASTSVAPSSVSVLLYAAQLHLLDLVSISAGSALSESKMSFL